MAYFRRRAHLPGRRSAYTGYRLEIRQDFRESCAYCLLEEIHAGGQENFELDHFRPKSLFPAYADSYYNLYWACHVCNSIKRNQWPSQALEEMKIGFVDLCIDDFDDHYQQLGNGTWRGLTLSGEYTIDALRLNRPHLAELRRRIINR